MKRIIISILLLVFVVSSCITELIFLKSLIFELKSDIKTMQCFVDNNEVDAAIEKNEELIHVWKEKHNLVSTFIDHGPLREIETSFEVMKINLENDEIEDFLAESGKALIQLEHLSSADMPLLGNIL